MTVIIPSWNEKENVMECVNVLKRNNPDAQIILVNNGSTDGTQAWIEEQGMDAIYYDEGVQTIGRVLNDVLENFPVEHEIFVLYPYVLVGQYTLEALESILQKNEQIGVVGCCANDEVFEQNINVSSYEELLAVEEEKRQETKDTYDVVGNSGWCFAFTKDLVEAIGGFDENLAYLDAFYDYQLRSMQAGYKNKVATKACVLKKPLNAKNIYWLNCLIQEDRKYLRKKWKMNYFMLSSNARFHSMIERAKEETFQVLEVGCDMGANLHGIKNQFPNCEIYGLEINQVAAELGSHLADIRYGNIEEEQVDFGVKFDYIIFGDVLEHLHNPQRTVAYCRSLLKENGRIIASIPNVMHISVMRQLLNGQFRYTDIGLLDKTHIHLFTQVEIAKMFAEEQYEIEKMNGIQYALEPEEEELLGELMKLSGEGVSEDMYKTYQYTVVARKLYE